MAYFIDLFSPETREAFSRSSRDVSGFRLRHKNMAARVKPGDFLVCYVTRLSRWFGLLQVLDGPFIDSSPVFVPENDPFPVRFHVAVKSWLELDKSLPIHEDEIWNKLTFTRDLPKDSAAWTGKVRGSLVRLDDSDGKFLAERLLSQVAGGSTYPLDEQDQKKLVTHIANRADKVIAVTVPEDAASSPKNDTGLEVTRESIKIQTLLARIGIEMGFTIWIPRADRGAVLKEWKSSEVKILEQLPLNYNETTIRTIEQIDVLWLKGSAIVRAFEVEHTTSVYSGLLRMADLLALQPNMDINLHIVAPEERRDKVFQEIKRPVFSLLDKGPLSESCTYISYDSVNKIASLEHLSHFSDSVLDEYAEEAQ